MICLASTLVFDFVLTGGKLLCIVMVSAVQQHRSVIIIFPPTKASLPSPILSL